MNIILSERMRLGMDQKALADSVGVSVATVSRWDRGLKVPSGEELVRLHEIFNCSVDYLLGLTQNRKPRN